VTESGPRTALGQLARLFLKVGTIGFGGPAAHIAMMEDEVVRRRRWLSREEFLDYIGATNLMPGPNSTELAIHIGRARAGLPGLLVAGTCFIAPAVIIVSVIAWMYVRLGALPAAAGVLYGVKPVVIAVVLQALWGLARTAVKAAWLAACGVAAVAAVALGVNELVVLGAAAALGAAGQWRRSAPARTLPALGALVQPGAAGSATAAAPAGVAATGALIAPAAAGAALWPLFAVFLKVGAVLFGSGYVLLAFLRADLVSRLHWLSERQLLDAIAVGQVTPGPVFTTATFVGYLLRGIPGAAVATAGIFLPAFVYVAASGVLVPRLRRSPVARGALDGVNVASLALMAVVTWQLAGAALVDPWTVLLAAAGAVLLLRFRVNSAWLVLGGGLAGVLLRTLA
jgi:chromate transporter